MARAKHRGGLRNLFIVGGLIAVLAALVVVVALFQGPEAPVLLSGEYAALQARRADPANGWVVFNEAASLVGTFAVPFKEGGGPDKAPVIHADMRCLWGTPGEINTKWQPIEEKLRAALAAPHVTVPVPCPFIRERRETSEAPVIRRTLDTWMGVAVCLALEGGEAARGADMLAAALELERRLEYGGLLDISFRQNAGSPFALSNRRYPHAAAFARVARAVREQGASLEPLLQATLPALQGNDRGRLFQAYCMYLNDSLSQQALPEGVRMEKRVFSGFKSLSFIAEAEAVFEKQAEFEEALAGPASEIKKRLDTLIEPADDPHEVLSSRQALDVAVLECSALERERLAAAIAVRLEAFRAARGAYPETLEALAPEFVPDAAMLGHPDWRKPTLTASPEGYRLYDGEVAPVAANAPARGVVFDIILDTLPPQAPAPPQ